MVWEKRDEDWDKSEENKTRLSIVPYKHASLFNAEEFLQPYDEPAVTSCPHYYDSIESVVSMTISYESSFIDYKTESKADKEARWYQSIDCDIKLDVELINCLIFIG